MMTTTALLAAGWARYDGPVDDVGECVAETGCSRPGRWDHPYVTGNYCAQHAAQGLSPHDSRYQPRNNKVVR